MMCENRSHFSLGAGFIRYTSVFLSVHLFSHLILFVPLYEPYPDTQITHTDSKSFIYTQNVFI